MVATHLADLVPILLHETMVRRDFQHFWKLRENRTPDRSQDYNVLPKTKSKLFVTNEGMPKQKMWVPKIHIIIMYPLLNHTEPYVLNMGGGHWQGGPPWQSTLTLRC